MTVCDASALVDGLRALPGGGARDALANASLPLAAPHLVDIEFASACRRLVLQRVMSAADGAELLRRFATIPLERFAHRDLMARIWELRDRLSAYDASYVALAEQLDADLLTADARLANAQGLRARIVLVD